MKAYVNFRGTFFWFDCFRVDFAENQTIGQVKLDLLKYLTEQGQHRVKEVSFYKSLIQNKYLIKLF